MDPYRILGIDRSATDDEVKKAYRNLARKYHPDKNPGNKAAEEMFKNINQAYDQIMEERKNGGGSYSSYNSGGYGGYSGGWSQGQGQTYTGPAENATKYQAAVNYINSGHFREAFNVLMSVKERDGMWFYLSALANMGLGNNYEAVQQAQTAASMEPDNQMFQDLVNRMSYGGNRYSNVQNNMYGNTGMTTGNYCANLCLCNLCLNAMCCC